MLVQVSFLCKVTDLWVILCMFQTTVSYNWLKMVKLILGSKGGQVLLGRRLAAFRCLGRVCGIAILNNSI